MQQVWREAGSGTSAAAALVAAVSVNIIAAVVLAAPLVSNLDSAAMVAAVRRSVVTMHALVSALVEADTKGFRATTTLASARGLLERSLPYDRLCPASAAHELMC